MDAIADRIEGSGTPAVPSATLEAEELWRQSPKHRRWISIGFGLGIVLGLGLAALQVAYQGYQVLPFMLIWNLISFPSIGLHMGYNLGRPRRTARWSWRRLLPPQIRTSTLMAVVAYVAILCGVGISTQRLGASARAYYLKYSYSNSLVKVYRQIGQKAGVDAERGRANVEGLRSGKIPEGLQSGQRDFLRTLEVDPKATPEFRKYRRGLIQDGEERTATMQARNAVVFEGIADYHERLAAKYDRARWHPWLPLEPDPPMPPLQ